MAAASRRMVSSLDDAGHEDAVGARLRRTAPPARPSRRRRPRSCRRSRCRCGRSARRCRSAPRLGRPRCGRRPRRCRTARPLRRPRGWRPPPRAPRPGPRCGRRRPRCRRTRLRGPRSPARSRRPRCDRRARASCRGPALLRPGLRRTRRCPRWSWRWPGSRPARGCGRSRHPRRWGARSRDRRAGRGGRLPCVQLCGGHHPMIGHHRHVGHRNVAARGRLRRDIRVIPDVDRVAGAHPAERA